MASLSVPIEFTCSIILKELSQYPPSGSGIYIYKPIAERLITAISIKANGQRDIKPTDGPGECKDGTFVWVQWKIKEKTKETSKEYFPFTVSCPNQLYCIAQIPDATGELYFPTAPPGWNFERTNFSPSSPFSFIRSGNFKFFISNFTPEMFFL